MRPRHRVTWWGQGRGAHQVKSDKTPSDRRKDMNLRSQRDAERPKFNRKRVFAAVETSNLRFNKYTGSQRRQLATRARVLSVFGRGD